MMHCLGFSIYSNGCEKRTVCPLSFHSYLLFKHSFYIIPQFMVFLQVKFGLTTDCGISRMAFYYHFKDIYDLVEWSCIEDASRALQGKKTYDTWQEGLQQIFEAVLENKPFILNVYRSVKREQVENYLYSLTYQLIEGVVEEQSENLRVTEEQKKFIADFYKYSFVGVMLDWIKRGMKEAPEEIANMVCVTMHGNVGNSLRNMEKEGQ